VIIDCIADLHGHYPKLDEGDLLIVAGDIAAHGLADEYLTFISWISRQKYEKKIWISGNHDNYLIGSKIIRYVDDPSVEYLCDSVTIFRDLLIWGSPWTLSFKELNPHCAAFTGSEAVMRKKFIQKPKGIDILVTHGPPYSVLDLNVYGDRCGSKELSRIVKEDPPGLHVFGHIHEAHGQEEIGETLFVNCSIMNERYQPIYSPTRVIL
jgi:Icc-related predicted phosphoesterase